MKTPTEFAEEIFRKEGITYGRGMIHTNKLADYCKSYALLVLDEVIKQSSKAGYTNVRIIAETELEQIRKELNEK